MRRRQSSKQEKVDPGREYLIFSLGPELYAVDILQVREIRRWEKLRELPEVPPFIPGVLDFRGRIIPIVDLRIRFSFETVDYSPTTVIMVLASADDQQIMGVVVDSVSDVLLVQPSEIKAAPDMGAKINTRYIVGMVSRGDDLIMLLDCDQLVDKNDLESALQAQEEGGQ
jgi:purine-binding chemotaxis protein CheW